MKRNPSVKPVWLICATLKTTLTLSSAKPSQSSPESVSMQVASPNNGGMPLFAVRVLTPKDDLTYMQFIWMFCPWITDISFSVICLMFCRIVQNFEKCLSPQTGNVHTTWSSWSVAVHVLTAALPLRPARHVTATAMMAAAALPVSTHILHYNIHIRYMQAYVISFMSHAQT